MSMPQNTFVTQYSLVNFIPYKAKFTNNIRHGRCFAYFFEAITLDAKLPRSVNQMAFLFKERLYGEYITKDGTDFFPI